MMILRASLAATIAVSLLTAPYGGASVGCTRATIAAGLGDLAPGAKAAESEARGVESP